MVDPTSNQSIFLSSTDYNLPDKPAIGLTRYADFREMSRGNRSLLRSCWDMVTGRTVAVKTLLPEVRDDRAEMRRLLREARVTAQLQHPNTVPVYDIGNDPEQGLFFTMKRISGENFFEVLKRVARGDEATKAAYPVWRRVQTVTDAAQALAYAHARGVIHRDMKPENIWVGNFGEVILLDWGVAKVWGQTDDGVSAPAAQQHGSARPGQQIDALRVQELTQAGQRPGTPLYMSPEQVEGKHVDERSDIFSTGVVLYEILTLREPFRGRVIQETFENILRNDPTPPSRCVQRIDFPKRIDRVVMRALAKHPSQRYQSMLELIDDVRDAMAIN